VVRGGMGLVEELVVVFTRLQQAPGVVVEVDT
jgi:hypothetical protein